LIDCSSFDSSITATFYHDIDKSSNIEETFYLAHFLQSSHFDRSIISVVPEFDNNERFVLGIIDFLEDIRWMEKESNSGEYIITEKGNNQI
jgi:hypothetical protein